MRRRLLGVAAAVAVLAATCVAPSAEAARAAAASAGPRAGGLCGGAELPAGFAVGGGIPYAYKAPTGTAFNGQSVSVFVNEVWKGTRTTSAQKRCLATWAIGVLVDRSKLVTFTDAHGTVRTARVFPYPSSFSSNPSLPVLKAGWLSGLTQGSVLMTLARSYDIVGVPQWLTYAGETFSSFLLPPERGGFVTEHHGVTYLQEYVTATASYVLNGHNEATIALIRWAARTGDADALALARRALAAIHTTSALEEIRFPTGLASSYDLLRGYPAAPLRLAPLTPLTVHAAALADGSGARLGTVRLAVTRAMPRAANRLANGSFSAWSRGEPTGWTVTGAGRYGSVTRGRSSESVRVEANGSGKVILTQDLPRVARATAYTLAWRARLLPSPGAASLPASVILQAVCGGAARNLGIADVRSRNLAEESVIATIPAGCVPRARLTQVDGAAPSAVELAQLSVFAADPVGPAEAPSLPISVMKTPAVSVRITYTGSGWLQAWVAGRWVPLAFLSGRRNATVTVPLPSYLQGRTVNLRYHNSHIAEFTALYQLTGDPVIRARALAWLDYAPLVEPLRAQLNATVRVNPLYADVIGG